MMQFPGSFLLIFGAFGVSGGLLEPSWVPGSIFSEKGVRKTPETSPKWDPFWNTFWMTFSMQFFSNLQAPKIVEKGFQIGRFRDPFWWLFVKRPICKKWWQYYSFGYFYWSKGAENGSQKHVKMELSKKTPKCWKKCPLGFPFGRLLGLFLALFLEISFRLKTGHLWLPRRCGEMASQGGSRWALNWS